MSKNGEASNLPMTSGEALTFAPKRILCAVDLTPMSTQVLQWARLAAEKFAAKLDVVYADYAEYPPYFLPTQAAELTAETQRRRSRLNDALASMVRDAVGRSASAEISVLEGHPTEAILGRIQSTNPDLVVIGSHGHGGFSRLRFGSVAEHLIRTTRTPILVTRTRGHVIPPRINRVLCPVTLEEMAHRTLQISAAVAQAFGAQLSVVHVIEQEQLDLAASQRELCQWVPAAVRDKCSIVESVRRGNPAEQILLAARDQSADLIVITAERRPFLDLAILGTTAERVLRHAESTVLVLCWKQGL
jgi:nucleotide-binding universal stress UspA family protein